MQSLVSVIIPVYNAEATIEKCIKSVLNQTLEKIEIIAVNDGSTDSSRIIIEEIKDKNDDQITITLINQKNQGVSVARNTGIEAANGEYITFVDSDDTIDENALESMYELATRHDLDLVSCNHIEENATLYQGNRNEATGFVADIEDIADHFNDLFTKSAYAKLFNADLIKQNNIRFPDEMQLGEDQYFTYQVIMACKRIGKIDNAYYRIENVNPESLSKRYVPDIERDLIKQERQWNELIARYPDIEKKYNETSMDFNLYQLSTFANNLVKRDCIFNSKQKIRVLNEFLARYADKITNVYKNHEPNNSYERIVYNIFKIQSAVVIIVFYKLKEIIKWIKLKVS